MGGQSASFLSLLAPFGQRAVCSLWVSLVSGHSRLNSGIQPFSFNSPRQHLCQTQTGAGGWWHNPDQKPSYNFNARNRCLKESPAVPPCRLFSLAVVPQFQLSTAFQLATPLSLDHLFHLGFQTPDRKFQILLPLMIREVILFIAIHWSNPYIWFLMPSRPTQTHQGIDIPSTCCPLFGIYYKSWNKAVLKVLVIQLCLTLCDPTECSPPGSSVHGILWPGLPEWVAITFSRGFSRPRDQTRVSCIAGKFLSTEPPGKPLKVFKTFMFEGVTLYAKSKWWKTKWFFKMPASDAAVFVSLSSYQCYCFQRLTKLSMTGSDPETTPRSVGSFLSSSRMWQASTRSQSGSSGVKELYDDKSVLLLTYEASVAQPNWSNINPISDLQGWVG